MPDQVRRAFSLRIILQFQQLTHLTVQVLADRLQVLELHPLRGLVIEPREGSAVDPRVPNHVTYLQFPLTE
ncbi:hypothetical protein AXH09_17915 [Pseudomonas aeruginosa]|nr:hypothetical protein AXH09_17915 [Pseudomonas aeruginosa]